MCIIIIHEQGESVKKSVNAKAPYDYVIRGFSYALVEHESDIATHDRFVSAL